LYNKNKTHHITASSITPRRLNNFNTQDFNHYTFLTYIYINYIILTKSTTILTYGVTTTQLTIFVRMYSCNNITLKMTAIPAEIYR
jgi:hypothetical protein